MSDMVKEVKNNTNESINPVKRGHWIWKFADNGWADWTCSECGWTWNDDIHVQLDFRYCPMCGSYNKGNE